MYKMYFIHFWKSINTFDLIWFKSIILPYIFICYASWA